MNTLDINILMPSYNLYSFLPLGIASNTCDFSIQTVTFFPHLCIK